MNGIDKVFKIAKMAKDLTNEEIKEVQEMIEEQKGYIHPFKMKTASDLTKIGEHNERILKAVVSLRVTVLDNRGAGE